MRLFVAIELPEIVRHHLIKVSDSLRETVFADGGVAWTRPEAYHLTLKFAGELADEKVAELADVLYSASAAEMRLQVTDFVCFPQGKPTRVIGAAVGGPDLLSLINLQANIESLCHSASIPLEGRAYHPHITLGRIKRSLPADIAPDLAGLGAATFPGPSFMAKQFVLMESHPSHEGSIYTPVARYVLHSRI